MKTILSLVFLLGCASAVEPEKPKSLCASTWDSYQKKEIKLNANLLKQVKDCLEKEKKKKK